jgi:transketolase
MQQFSADQIRKIILEQSYRAHVGHIGSALSVVDILVAVYSTIHIENIDSLDRDRFILSNGHAALALYSILFSRGILTQEELDTFCGDGSYLGVHPDRAIRGVDFSTGSLGQGLSYGAGSALAAQRQGSKRRIFVLLSDAECNEGSIWETVIFASHHRLSNLIVIIDFNGQQALGYTRDILDLSPMSDKWKAFYWNAYDVDGNNVDEIVNVINSIDTMSGQPHVIVAHTIFGKGVSFMEKQIKWHYFPMTDEEYSLAIQEINNKKEI